MLDRLDERSETITQVVENGLDGCEVEERLEFREQHRVRISVGVDMNRRAPFEVDEDVKETRLRIRNVRYTRVRSSN